jgi:hypothetical protein
VTQACLASTLTMPTMSPAIKTITNGMWQLR